ncbi:MAG: hypothetical protein ACUVWX_14115 [Kiritimatiellia bacterium]
MKAASFSQQTTKIVAAIALGTILVVIGMWEGIAQPLVRAKRDQTTRLHELQTKIGQATQELRKAVEDRNQNTENLIQIIDISDRYLLHPSLGNYLISATVVLEKHAAKCGVTLESVRDAGLFDLPASQRKKGTVNYLRCYTARVVLRVGFFDLVRLLSSLETENPYLCIGALSITPQASGDVERHTISFDVQWPVWSDEDLFADLERQLQQDLTPEVRKIEQR